ncbi:Putative Possible apospory-associated protein c (AFU_orthologue; AFUA_4G08880) [Aspergillus calidoustus]|uniref:Glucose-6-phosphate 1-epimerase n=1 Tax=Aspergillus calidoustus TaxID=454130 RepID=A0A0U5GE51_ASPCI|nr:Putative Possible apospory-associated protein c (AFU_orthologue; AFUA_4G08880) [Aspergillus calidoustus]
MDRSKKPAAIGVTATPPQPTISLANNVVQATLPSGESVTVHLYGATVTSWKTASGAEQLWLSEAAALDGSKPIRGGIPVVFPVFGPPPANHATSSLPQHGFARNSLWEFLGKSSSESTASSTTADNAVKLDFGLSSSMLSNDTKSKWPYEFGLVYSVTLSREGLGTSLQVRNQGSENFEFQVLLHTYLAIEDISTIQIKSLQGKSYIDKVLNATEHTETATTLQIASETDRVYKGLDPAVPIVVSSASNGDLFSITREGLTDAVIWNPWIEKAKGMGDFSPDDGYKKMVCVEAGAVSSWTALEAGESWEGGQFIRPSA